ncbi:TetR/AcrR family transcriptional regulator [Microbulbifer variabilis]|uniref:TetR/AcrR family transcriptional regulator n=1 Tax=Microbulbifer variabilis TaxID=266805 RepID=A0ABY4V9G4_9GAMM|nr:TetR/AcrR family transcriptional regulator [Microbulbifer variabilis]USD20908.1 TetR/AcrR family transcriptional regulator [Microbulbifer variabilis]
MARPRKSENTKEALLEAGTAMLTSQGYHGTGIKQVLDAVGVPKGSFYNYFPSKEAFVASIIHRYGQQIDAELAQTIINLDQAPGLIQLWCCFHNRVQNKVKVGQSCACLLGAMSAEVAQASPLCREAIESVEHRWLENLQSILHLAQDQGDLRSDVPADNLATLCYSVWQGSILQYQVSGDPNDLLRQLRTFFSTLVTQQGAQTLASIKTYRQDIHFEK